MSARVFNSRVVELGRAMRPSAAAAAAPEPCSQALDRVRRNLFGPVDPEESRRILERELALINRRDEELYEFDFVRERPIAGPARRFPWERVHPGGVPESYALRCLAFLGMQPSTPAPAAAAPAPAPAPATASASAAADPAPAPAAAALPPCTPAPARTRRQAHIHEFMRSRKRPLASSVKDGVKAAHPSKSDAPTPKRRRATVPAAAAASASASAPSAAAAAAASQS